MNNDQDVNCTTRIHSSYRERHSFHAAQN